MKKFIIFILLTFIVVGCFAIKQTPEQKDSIIKELKIENVELGKTVVYLDSLIFLNEKLDYQKSKTDSLNLVINNYKSTEGTIAVVTYGIIIFVVFTLAIWFIVRQIKKDDL